jgi:tetratricopeptide (TPR) repeat protein
VPRQMPSGVRHFVSRSAELDLLSSLMTNPGSGARLAVISGTAGMGKTALTLHWGHQAASAFPDGQLYVNLRGFDPSEQPLPPAQAIRLLLDALTPAERIPAEPDAQVALYRSFLSARQVLVVLDNARDAEQVRPLLPGGAACMTIITSRNQLLGLAATEEACQIRLRALSPEHSLDLLRHRLGEDRLASQPEAASQLVRACAGLPLALAIVAARVGGASAESLPRLAADMSADPDRLDALETDESGASIRAALSASYDSLPSPLARMFRLLGLLPTADIPVAVAASLAAVPVPEAGRLLVGLSRAHLLDEEAPGRCQFHDLVRSFAAQKARSPEFGAAEPEAMGRVLDYYRHTAYTAQCLLNPLSARTHAAPPPGLVAESLANRDQAVGWYQAEYRSLLALVAYANVRGLDDYARQIPLFLSSFLETTGHWSEVVTAWEPGLASAKRAGDRRGMAYAHRGLAAAFISLGQYDQAHPHLRQALALHRATANVRGEATVHLSFALAYERQGRYGMELAHARRACRLYRQSDSRGNREAYALNAVAWAHARLGEYAECVSHGRQALDLLRELDDDYAVASTMDSLGLGYHGLGDLAEALRCFQQALDWFSRSGSRPDAAGTLARIGDCHQSAGDLAAARRAWQRSLVIFEELQPHMAREIRDKLSGSYRDVLTTARLDAE